MPLGCPHVARGDAVGGRRENRFPDGQCPRNVARSEMAFLVVCWTISPEAVAPTTNFVLADCQEASNCRDNVGSRRNFSPDPSPFASRVPDDGLMEHAGVCRKTYAELLRLELLWPHPARRFDREYRPQGTTQRSVLQRVHSWVLRE
jgi:hypothetical protein